MLIQSANTNPNSDGNACTYIASNTYKDNNTADKHEGAEKKKMSIGSAKMFNLLGLF